MFNPFVLVRLPNPVPLVWLGLVATLAGVLVRVARGAPRSAIGFAFATLPASYLSVNPPLLIMAAVTLLAVTAACSALVGPGGTRRAARFLARSLPWCIVLNLWWLVPTVLSTVARQGIAVAAETRVEDWAWSHGQNTVGNVVTLTADWGWKYPEYLPFRPEPRRRALELAALDPPAACARGAIRHDRSPPHRSVDACRAGNRRQAFHREGPSSSARFLEPVALPPRPRMWLLCEPAGRAGGVVLLAEIVLALITLTALCALPRIPRRRRSPARDTLGIAVLGGAVCLALAFPIPSGRVASAPMEPWACPRTTSVPAAWHDLAADVNSSPVRGKVLVLPLDPYYQVTTTWGFHGADELVKDLIRRPVLQLLPGGYFSPAGDVPTMLHATEDALTSLDVDRARTLLRMLGVSHVIVRHDIAGAGDPLTADLNQLDAACNACPALRRRATTASPTSTVSDGAPLPDPRHGHRSPRRDAKRRAGARRPRPDTAAVALRPHPSTCCREAADLPEYVGFTRRKPGRLSVRLAKAHRRRTARVVGSFGAGRTRRPSPGNSTGSSHPRHPWPSH